MLKLLITTPKYPPQPGGASYVFSLISQNLSAKLDITILTSTVNKRMEIKGKKVKTFRLFPYFEYTPIKILFSPLTLFTVFIFFLLNSRKFDVVESHTVGEICIFSQIFAKLFRKKLVKHILDMSTPPFLLRHPIPDKFINCGETITKKLKRISIPETMIKEIKLPISYRKNSTYKKKGKKIFLFVGEISQRKGISDILCALKSIKKQDFELWFIGNGPLVDQLKTEAQKDTRIKYLGLLKNEKVVDLMKKTDILIHPTYADVMPLTILEAMMMGNAVLSTDIGEIKQTVGKAGIIIKPGDKKALEKSIIKLLNSNLNQMKKTAIKNFSAYSKQDVYQRNLDAVESVC